MDGGQAVNLDGGRLIARAVLIGYFNTAKNNLRARDSGQLLGDNNG